MHGQQCMDGKPTEVNMTCGYITSTQLLSRHYVLSKNLLTDNCFRDYCAKDLTKPRARTFCRSSPTMTNIYGEEIDLDSI